ncbi:MAG: phosphotransferase family protein [Candidatus Hodarchaeales archaeon]|jgi:aminoglycoside 2''-phosphotransferase
MTYYEERNPKDISISRVVPVINKFLPDSKVNDIKFLYHGTYNVFEVEGRFIFRIPDKSLRNKKGIQMIESEYKNLKLLKPNLSIPIPDPIYVNLEETVPAMGYRKLPGISLSKCIREYDNKCLKKLARSIGFFLTQLHSVKLTKKFTNYMNLNNSDFLAKYTKVWEKEYQETKSIVLPLVNSEQKKWIQALYTLFLSKIDHFSFEPTVIHGDFDTSNILVDSGSCKLSGIIDFEETRIFDPAVDFLFYREGKLFQDEILAFYGGIIDKDFQQRMQFTFSRSCIPYILYGVKNSIPSLIEAGKELLTERMTFFS